MIYLCLPFRITTWCLHNGWYISVWTKDIVQEVSWSDSVSAAAMMLKYKCHLPSISFAIVPFKWGSKPLSGGSKQGGDPESDPFVAVIAHRSCWSSFVFWQLLSLSAWMDLTLQQWKCAFSVRAVFRLTKIPFVFAICFTTEKVIKLQLVISFNVFRLRGLHCLLILRYIQLIGRWKGERSRCNLLMFLCLILSVLRT